MKSRAQIFALIAVAAVLVIGFVTLYRLRLGRGDFFPPYSSLRSDPLGTRVLHESLVSLPGLQVTRGLRPLNQLASAPARTIVLAGLSLDRWNEITEEELAALEAAARGGSRVVIAFRGATASDDTNEEEESLEESPTSETARKKNEEIKTDKPKDADREIPPRSETPVKAKEEEDDDEPKFVDVGARWQVPINERALFGPARREASAAPARLPAEVRWESNLYFERAAGTPWRVIYRRGFRPVLLERRYGVGSIVLASDAYFLSNEALQRDRATSLLTWMIGALPHVEFVESHLGVVDDPGVAALARRYGLGGAFCTLLVLAALFVWRRVALFVPATEKKPGMVLDYNQTAGLEALLRRAVPPEELTKVCAAEWRTTARAPEQARLDAVLAATPRTASPTTTYNSIVRALRRR